MAQAPRAAGNLVQNAAQYLDQLYGYSIGRIPTVQYYPQLAGQGSAATSGEMGINIFADPMKRSLNRVGRTGQYDRVRDAWAIQAMLHELGHQAGPFDYGTPGSRARFIEEGLSEQFSADAAPAYVRDALHFTEPINSHPDSYIPNVNKVRRMSWNAARIANPEAPQNYELADSEAAKLFRARMLGLSWPGRQSVINKQLAKIKAERARTGILPDASVADYPNAQALTEHRSIVPMLRQMQRGFGAPPRWAQVRKPGPPYRSVLQAKPQPAATPAAPAWRESQRKRLLKRQNKAKSQVLG
jgi:hypothetical protein